MLWLNTECILKPVLECLIRDDAVALRVQLLPILPHLVFEKIRFRAARVRIVISSAPPMILDELAEVLKAYVIPEVFVHDLELYLAASIALTFNTLHS